MHNYLSGEGHWDWYPSPISTMEDEPIVDSPLLTRERIQRTLINFMDKKFVFRSYQTEYNFTEVRWSTVAFIIKVIIGFLTHNVLEGLHGNAKNDIFGRQNRSIKLSLSMRFGMDNLYIYRQSVQNNADVLFMGVWHKHIFYGVQTTMHYEPISSEA